MSKVKIELNRAGVRALLRSDEMAALLRKKADAAAARCGDGYEAGSYLMPTRAVARVGAVSAAARQQNLENNTILRALGISASAIAQAAQSAASDRTGKVVAGYYRTTKDGRTIFVHAYQRRK